MIGSKDPEYAVSQDKVQQAAIEMYMYSNELAKKRREEPRDDRPIVNDSAGAGDRPADDRGSSDRPKDEVRANGADVVDMDRKD